MKPLTIEHNSGVGSITYTPSFSTICSVGKSPFHGTIHITYTPDKYLLEFEAFERWLFSESNNHHTIEGYCRLVFNTLTEALGDIPLSVIVQARTTVHAPASATIERKASHE